MICITHTTLTGDVLLVTTLVVVGAVVVVVRPVVTYVT